MKSTWPSSVRSELLPAPPSKGVAFVSARVGGCTHNTEHAFLIEDRGAVRLELVADGAELVQPNTGVPSSIPVWGLDPVCHN